MINKGGPLINAIYTIGIERGETWKIKIFEVE